MHLHSTVRGLIIRDNAILLTRVKGDTKTFLPGGHIEPGESASITVMRELQEEANLSVKVERLLGAVENGWTDNKGINTELCLLFLLSVNTDKSENIDVIESQESHIDYFWVTQEELLAANLYPVALRNWLIDAQLNITSAEPAFWGTDL
ncbi:NUDIX domain-containing protein [Photobacterium lucens]|uniref:NUDIX domain-containing protein n=1 Tax=Photobacterium lucens TaxID=2562949 RepID=UPI00136CAD62|nr:NUDIX domain-containing protein [Photobacterium lucens]MBP2702024.1 NUDIX domain-containing protein [Vibrio parahaemolyticus]MZG57794.1 NUDIX domain-containing protein [Photobacterium lucens]MZG79198.1 NUDIX domain-containing protein [Photobacterium lucens]